MVAYVANHSERDRSEATESVAPTHASDVVGQTIDPLHAEAPVGKKTNARSKKGRKGDTTITSGTDKLNPTVSKKISKKTKPGSSKSKKENKGAGCGRVKKQRKQEAPVSKNITEKVVVKKATGEGTIAKKLSWDGVSKNMREIRDHSKAEWKRRVCDDKKKISKKEPTTYLSKRIRRHIKSAKGQSSCMSTGRIGKLSKWLLEKMVESEVLPDMGGAKFRIGDAARKELCSVLECDMIKFMESANAMRYASKRSKFMEKDFICAE